MTKHHQRKSPRLPGYDYATEGAYFVTVCTQERRHLFGTVRDGDMHLNPAGEMIASWWRALPEKFPDVVLDCAVVMPNHTHAVIVINRAHTPESTTSLPDALHALKTMTTNAYIHGVRNQNWEAFPGKLWQRSYHDHIIRDESGLNRIRHYVATNPARWQDDTFYASP